MVESTHDLSVSPQNVRRRKRLAWTGICALGTTAIVLTASNIWFDEVRYYAASGTVIYAGKPVDSAAVSFVPLDHDGAMSEGRTDSEGRFKLSTAGRKGLPAGTYRVAIRAVQEEDDVQRADFSDPHLTDEDRKRIMITMMEAEPQLTRFRVPQKYASPFSSGITAEVSSDADQNQYRFELN